jgi:ribosomal protein S6--L-glutamate ligase
MIPAYLKFLDDKIILELFTFHAGMNRLDETLTTFMRVRMKRAKHSLLVDVGWCEWVAFPQLKIPAIEAQIDMNSPISLLHIFDYTTFKEGEDLLISFGVNPIQKNTDVEVYSVAAAKNRRLLTGADGTRHWCYSIETELRIGSMKKNVELFLVKDSSSTFRLHLASQAMKKLANIDPRQRYMTGHLLSPATIGALH